MTKIKELLGVCDLAPYVKFQEELKLGGQPAKDHLEGGSVWFCIETLYEHGANVIIFLE